MHHPPITQMCVFIFSQIIKEIQNKLYSSQYDVRNTTSVSPFTFLSSFCSTVSCKLLYCELLVTVFPLTNQYITFYKCFCLKTPCFIHIVDSVTLKSLTTALQLLPEERWPNRYFLSRLLPLRKPWQCSSGDYFKQKKSTKMQKYGTIDCEKDTSLLYENLIKTSMTILASDKNACIGWLHCFLLCACKRPWMTWKHTIDFGVKITVSK